MGNLTAPIQWIGSKVRMRKRIIPLFEQADYKMYVEPFGGAGAMFYGIKPKYGVTEIYNDSNCLLVNLFKQLREPEAVETIINLCNITPHARATWHEFRDVSIAYLKGEKQEVQEFLEQCNLTSIPVETAIAFCFFYAQQNSFGGKVLSAYGGGVAPSDNDRFCDSGARRYYNKVELLKEYGARFRNVLIENLDFAEMFKKYDRKYTLFYCDPPYETVSSNAYRQGWTNENTERLVELCSNCQGSVVLSCYDSPVYESLLERGFEKASFEAYSSVCKDSNKKLTARVETVYYKLLKKEEVVNNGLFNNAVSVGRG